MRWNVPGVAAIVIALAGAAAATRGVAAGQQPVFRSAVDVTTIDVTVVDNNGKPIDNLKPDDFRVTVDGRARRVVRADWISFTTPVTTQPAAPPEGYSTNETGTGGRMILIAIDQPNIRFDRAAGLRSSVNAFIDRLQPADRIAAVPLGGGASTPFTANRAVVKEAIARMSGSMRPTSEMSDYDIGLAEATDIASGNTAVLDHVYARECVGRGLDPDSAAVCRQKIDGNAFRIATSIKGEAQETLLALRAMLDALKGITGPKTVVLVSEGFVLEDQQPAIIEIGSMAAAAQTSLYVLRLDSQVMDVSIARNVTISAAPGGNQRGPSLSDDRQIRSDGVGLLASVAKGEVFDVLGTGSSAFQRIEREISGYYLVGVESAPTDTDGRAHPIHVQVSPRNAIVRARRELANPTTARVGAGAAGASSVSPIEAVTAALSAPLPISSLPLRVATFSLREPNDSKIQVVIHADVGNDYSSAKEVTLAYVITDTKGATVISQTANGRLPPAANGTPSPLVFSGDASLDPGEYTLKLAVTEGGRVGSVEHPVHAGLVNAGPVTVSELMIGGPLDARALLRATVGYEVRFGSVQGYIEAYGPAADTLTMKYELAPGMDAPSVFSSVVPGRPADNDRTVFSYIMPVRELAAGKYYLRATLSSGDKVVHKTARAFTVAPAPLPAATTAAAGGGTAVAAANRVNPANLVLPVGDDIFARRFRREDAARGDTRNSFRERMAPAARRPFDEGTAWLAAGDYARAEQSFKAALDAGLSGADSTAALAYLGATYAASGRDVDAASIWQIALVDGAGYPQLYEWYGDALMRAGEMDQARTTFEEALAKWPVEPSFARAIAMIYARSGRSREAIAMLSRQLAIDKGDLDALSLGVEWMYQLHAAGAVVQNREADISTARTWADAYTIANGPRSEAVKQRMLALEALR